MLDQTTTRTDPLRNPDRWGYTGQMMEDPVPLEESGGASRWLLWVALIAIAVIVAVALLGSPM